MGEVIYIPDEIKKVVTATSSRYAEAVPSSPVYYKFGHWIEIVQHLQQQTNAAIKKYPLIALSTDITIERGRIGVYGLARINVAIMVLSDMNYTSEQRLEKSFKAVLQPLKEIFLEELVNSKQFTSEGQLVFKETERYFLGKQGLYGNVANEANEYLDAIELSDLEIIVNNPICSTIKSNVWQTN